MFRYVLVILLITCYYSLGHPATVPHRIPLSIQNLANNCGNSVLKKVFTDRLSDCNVTGTQYKLKHLQCLMLYDMGSQLCTAITTSQITVNEDFSSKINVKTDLNSLCETTKDWVLKDLPEFIKYKNLTEMELKHPSTCGNICGLDDETVNDNANWYCKFYKWGWEVIHVPVSTLSQNNTNVIAVAPNEMDTSSIIIDVNIDSPKNMKEPLDISIKSTTNDKPKETAPSSVSSEKVIEGNNVPAPIQDVLPNTKENAPPMDAKDVPVPNQIDLKVKKPEETQTINKKPEEPSNVAPANVIPVAEKVDKEVQNKKIVSKVPLSDPRMIESNIGPETLERKESVIENPRDKAIVQGEHYSEEEFNSEDGKDENDDIQGDDDVGDPMTSDDIKGQQKNSPMKNKIEPSDSALNKEIIPPKEFFSGNAQDLSSSDDDDHFFTFFLTAVVLVVLLYILYHDKSKISKLFFGLLVEGRSGRRRNSRGHAYRRLDTLEQAMSANTTAPPSKIIY